MTPYPDAVTPFMQAVSQLVQDPRHEGSLESEWHAIAADADRLADEMTPEHGALRYAVLTVGRFARQAARHERRLHIGSLHPRDIPAERRARGAPLDARHLPHETRAAIAAIVRAADKETP